MPSLPKSPCRVCRRLQCDDPTHKPKPWQGATATTVRRPEYKSAVQTKRRAAAVAEFLTLHGHELPNGDVIAYCPDCGVRRARWVADHVVPMAFGGTEGGQLRVHCLSCSRRQGGEIGHKKSRQ